VKAEPAVTLSRNELVDEIIEVIRSEAKDVDVEIRMSTPIDNLNIDSVDVINILFQLEDKYKISIDMDVKARPETVGDLVNALVEFVPHGGDTP
jgi:acyl carrier protein